MTPAFELHLGDCLGILRTLPADSVDTVITDPPYGLSFMGNDWDHGIPGVHFWQEAIRVAKPGAMLLAFGGTRTHHRLMCAIEDAGWEIRDVLMWLYGSGFPKSHDISKAIDAHGGQPVGWFGPWLRAWRTKNGITQKEIAALFPSASGNLTGCVANWELGFNMPTPEQFNLICQTWGLPFDSLAAAEREVIGTEVKARSANGSSALPTMGAPVEYREWNLTAPATPAAAEWQGWGTALKPAWEPIILAMKPLDGTFAQNALRHGVAGLNVDGARIATDDNLNGGAYSPSADGMSQNEILGKYYKRPGEYAQPAGRWPANVLLDEDAAAALDAQSGERPSRPGNSTSRSRASGFGMSDRHAPPSAYIPVDDTGGASRFFYVAKASRAERERGLEGMPERDKPTMDGGEFRNPAWENARSNKEMRARNHHPTVKPLRLMEYLCTLTATPTGGVVLDPFMGSGTTGMAAIRTGRGFIGCEIDPSYFEIAKRRIEDAAAQLPLPPEMEQ